MSDPSPQPPKKAKVAGLKGAIRESEWLLRWAKKEAAKLERSVGKGTAEDPETACLKLKRARVQLELRRGECEGLEKELVALREYLGETVKQQQKEDPEQGSQAGSRRRESTETRTKSTTTPRGAGKKKSVTQGGGPR